MVGAGSALAQETQRQNRQGEDGRFQFRATVQAINLSVVVTDKKGRFIPDLTVDDFEVYEDNARQKIDFFTSEVTPVTLLPR